MCMGRCRPTILTKVLSDRLYRSESEHILAASRRAKRESLSIAVGNASPAGHSQQREWPTQRTQDDAQLVRFSVASRTQNVLGLLRRLGSGCHGHSDVRVEHPDTDRAMGHEQIAGRSAGHCGLIMAAVGGWIGGILADRFGRVRILQITILWFAGFTFLAAFTNSYGSSNAPPTRLSPGAGPANS